MTTNCCESHKDIKSRAEILKRLRELVHRHRKRFLKDNLAPVPKNCDGYSKLTGRCDFCGGDKECKNEKAFVFGWDKKELEEEFNYLIKKPELLVREYRDVAVLLWVLGLLDSDENLNDKIKDAMTSIPKEEITPTVVEDRQRSVGIPAFEFTASAVTNNKVPDILNTPFTRMLRRFRSFGER